jgi:protocatechuate 3,4-dioxygenase beta subunit
MMEGPYYAPGSPERSSLLEPGMEGTKLVITGYVLTPECESIPGAWLDFWQTDANGVYDNAGFRLRGHQYTGPNGSYRLETVLPGEYPGRTAHIHVKVQAPGGQVLTTQLFFPGSQGNTSDSIFSERLLVVMETGQDSLQGTFNFILENP